ncbi:MAG: SHOCT domain-containing protein [SAR202 cluster bacterium]|nr:SHOCT domain-containing protein [SAR202 cluster bacterium]
MEGNFSMGIWIVFPIIFFVLMFIGMSRMFGMGGFGQRNHESPRISGDPTQPEAPLDILNGRYARGEITKDEFDQMKQDLA